MQLGKMTLSGDMDRTGAVSVSHAHEPSNLAQSNIDVFDAAQTKERGKLLKAVRDAAAAYFAYVNRPHADVRAESETIQAGVTVRAGVMDGDKAAPKKTAPAKKG